jgi:hypothetical protein
MIIGMFSGCGVLKKLGLGENDNDELRPVSSVAIGEEEAKKLTDKIPVHLYFANADNTKLKLEIRYITVSEAKKGTGTLAAWIVKELIKGPVTNKNLKATIPPTTQLRGPVKVEAGVATVDLTKDFISKHTGDKAAEKMTIYSIVNSLTELKDIQKVKFRIDGKTQKDFKGSFQFDAPFPRAAQLINREADPPATTDTNKKDATTKGSSNDGAQETAGDGSEQTSGDDVLETSGEGAEAEYIEILE